MNHALQLRLSVSTHRITIEATGQLTALTAHLLTKAVVGALRRYPAPALDIDLTGVTAIDFVGDTALQDCASETTRRGVLLTITEPPPAIRRPPQDIHHNRETRRRGPRARTLTHAGTICGHHLNTRQPPGI